jgi:two-component system CheB/CheR fusion protein
VSETEPQPQSPATAAPPPSSLDFPVVGIGASAGGLHALTSLVEALPVAGGMAYILVQHLDPRHKSLLADLLTRHTQLPITEAREGSVVERDHIYVIPAGLYLTIAGGTLHLQEPTAPHGTRMPIDFLFESMAKDLGGMAFGIVLSGTGTDGTCGITAMKSQGGFVLVQDVAEAEYDGMPQSAIASGCADSILPVAAMPAALQQHARLSGAQPGAQGALAGVPADTTPDTTPEATPEATTDEPAHIAPGAEQEALPAIIALLRQKTQYDFTQYKMGTLQRRIERRMALASIPATGMAQYLVTLEQDAAERNLLATDLLINVTSFFRDAQVFDLLATTIAPQIVGQHPEDVPLRIWVAGCSTGEEAYSLAMIFTEAISAADRTIKLCILASDVDADAIATARAGAYPETISTEVSAERLARFFVRREDGYTVGPELRADIVFSVQDLLVDPPFSRIDLVSCRNLLIYLGPDAQAKAVGLFHFALRPGGTLLLGSSETVGHADEQFTPIAKPQRLYRHIGKSPPGTFLFSPHPGDGMHVPSSAGCATATARQPILAELCRRLVLERFAPAVVLINRRHECLYSLGATERYLRVAPGYPTHDLLAMAAPGLRANLRAAIGKVGQSKPHVVSAGGRVRHEGKPVPFDIDVRSVMHDGEELLLIGFIDRHGKAPKSGGAAVGDAGPRIADLEQELEIAHTDLAAALHDLAVFDEEHRAVNEEALSVNEEYQSTNEELLTSKEELQSLNEELTALNSQLQETLERQRTTSNDLQNVLYSTDVATLFLDADLNIRFFTPATKALFHLIPGDIGRPLSDLRTLFSDPSLADDARAVLQDSKASDREVRAEGDIWFMRHILPYRTDSNGVEGVVITFTNITEKKNARSALEMAKREAEQANLAKSRFLAAASHDLRQPLQALALLQGLLLAKVKDEGAHNLLVRLEQTLTTMSGMLNTMLDINQIEAGIVQPRPVDFVIGDLMQRVRGEFIEQAHAQRLDLRLVRSSKVLHSDPDMIEQMLRNLVSNALKYTRRGKILIGCRQKGDRLRLEVWDTGVGIAASQLDAIFDEYHQIDNAARERRLGLGLGLSIVQRLGMLLGHTVSVRSVPRKGSVFSVEVILPRVTPVPAPPSAGLANLSAHQPPAVASGNILIVDDDPELRDLLALLLGEQGYRTATAFDARAALDMIATGAVDPDLVLTDYNLPGGMDGLQLASALRTDRSSAFPVIILTGDISTDTLRDVAALGCLQLNKPVSLDAMVAAIRLLLHPAPPATPDDRAVDARTGPTIYIVDDDSSVRTALRELLETQRRQVEDFASCEAFLAAYRPGGEACLLIDAHLPGIDGIALLRQLKAAGHHLPAIMITGNSAVPMAVEAMKVGAIDFIEKPVACEALIASIDRALDLSRDSARLADWQADAVTLLKGLTPRQRQVMDMVLAGHPSKNIATDLHISQRTVENHRAAIMRKTGATSLPALARIALAAGALPAD